LPVPSSLWYGEQNFAEKDKLSTSQCIPDGKANPARLLSEISKQKKYKKFLVKHVEPKFHGGAFSLYKEQLSQPTHTSQATQGLQLQDDIEARILSLPNDVQHVFKAAHIHVDPRLVLKAIEAYNRLHE